MRIRYYVLYKWLVIVVNVGIVVFMGLMGGLGYCIFRRRRNIARINIDSCFCNESWLARRFLLYRTFFNFFYGLWEAFLAWSLPHQILESLIRDNTSKEVLVKLQKNAPCLVICPHYSCLEMVAPALSMNLEHLVMSYRPHENARLEGIVFRGRSRFGDLVDVTEVRLMIKALKGSAQLWFGPDQDKGSKGSVFSTFFGVPAATVTTPARLARISGAPIYFVRFRRKFLIYEMMIEQFPSNYPTDDEILNADILNQFIEHAIESDRSQYMWFHRRFKTQPNASRYSLYQ